jgi:hypothetical protein
MFKRLIASGFDALPADGIYLVVCSPWFWWPM